MEVFDSYQAPQTIDLILHPVNQNDRRRRKRIAFQWLAAFCLNLITPLIFGWSLTSEHSRTGTTIAAFFFLALGSAICFVSREFGSRLVTGAFVIALSQIFPILQLGAGLIGLTIGQSFGQVIFAQANQDDQILSELGGFAVTFITGGILFAISVVLGVAIHWLVSREFWQIVPDTSGS